MDSSHAYGVRKETFLIGSHDRFWDNAVIPTWPVDRPLPAEADASACIRDRRLRVAAVAPGFACPQQFDGMMIAGFCIGLRGVSGWVLTGSVS